MKSSVKAPTTNTGASGKSGIVSLVRPQYRTGFEIPALSYQKGGVMSKVLWPSKNHVIRIIPGYDSMTGEVFRQNVNCESFAMDAPYTDYLSDTFMLATVTTGFGDRHMTMITDYAPGSPDEQKWGGDTLLSTFLKNVTYSCMGKFKPKFKPIPEWSQWVDFKDGKLKKANASILMQALMYMVNGSGFNDMDGNAMVDESGNPLPLFGVVAIDNKASQQLLMQALVEPSDPGLPLDGKTNNRYRGLAELDGVRLYLNASKDAQGKNNVLKPSVQAPGQGWKPTPDPLDEEDVRMLWVPWEDLLQYQTADEQAHLIASEFGNDTFNYVIGTDPLFHDYCIPQDIASAGLGRYADATNRGTSLPQRINVQAQRTPQVQAQAKPAAKSPLFAKTGAGVDLAKMRQNMAALKAATVQEPSEESDLAAGLIDDSEEVL